MAYTAIDNPELYFQTKLFTGTGSALSVTLDGSEDMQPDLVWIKERSAADSAHNLTDSVRGAGKGLFSNTSAVEYDYGTGSDGTVRSFDSDGFTLGTATQVNPSSVTMVAWCWKESATAGFDIVAYSGTGNSTDDISHSLGATPELIIIKQRSTGDHNWIVWHHTQATNYIALLDTTGAFYSPTTATINEANHSSSVFGIATNDSTNESGETYISYLWRSVQGFSSMGSYIGNGNADGTFVYTGFRPAWVVVKESSGTSNWLMFDNKRDISNGVDNYVKANANDAENSGTDYMDFLSNGFKSRTSQTFFNESGSTYIYMAFAEAPFVNSNGVPCNAR